MNLVYAFDSQRILSHEVAFHVVKLHLFIKVPPLYSIIVEELQTFHVQEHLPWMFQQEKNQVHVSVSSLER